MTTSAVVDDLLACWRANAEEVDRLGDIRRGPRPAAERLQMALWRHRDELIRLLIGQASDKDYVEALETALRPFAMGAAGVPAHNPVVVSLPMQLAGGRTWVQWRSADFRRAADLLGLPV